MSDNIAFQSYRIAFRSKSLFRNINIKLIMERFSNAGYSFRLSPPVINPVADETGVGIKGPVLQKGEIIIDINSDINSIGIQFNNLDVLIKEIEETFLPRLKDIEYFYHKMWFYEFQGKIKVKNMGISIFNTIKPSNIQNIINIVDNDKNIMKIRGLTLWSNDNPDSENFAEVKLSPDLMDTNLMVYQLIFRTQQENNFFEKLEYINKNIHSLDA